jgi:hypothetical protein
LRRPSVAESLVYSAADLQIVLGVGRRRAYEIAREIGVRVSPRRLVIPKAAVEELLADGKRPEPGASSP